MFLIKCESESCDIMRSYVFLRVPGRSNLLERAVFISPVEVRFHEFLHMSCHVEECFEYVCHSQQYKLTWGVLYTA